MGKVKLLDKQIINKIAAGEVIDRPFSVVKELLENSIDSGATQIVIELLEGGKRLISIEDNGNGILAEDLPLVIKRHATSKIYNEDDLFKILTLGFRGEALSSVCSIAKVSISSKVKDLDLGKKINVEEGKIVSEEELPMQEGTKITVSDIFYNTPARQKYLKSESAEYDAIMRIIMRYALCYDSISFRVIHNGKLTLNTRASSDKLNIISQVWGADVAKNMLVLEHENEFFKVKGFVGKPYVTKANKNYQYVYVNKRYVKNKAVFRGISDAYHSQMFLRRHPVCLLFVEVDPTQIDVNVHPTKEIIRVEKEEELYTCVYEGIHELLVESNLTPDVGLNKKSFAVDLKEKQETLAHDGNGLESGSDVGLKSSEEPGKSAKSESKGSVSQASYEKVEDVSSHVSTLKKSVSAPYPIQKDEQTVFVNESQSEYKAVKQKDAIFEEKSNAIEERFGKYKIVGILNQTYILLETESGLVLIDQHAAEERVNFEEFMQEFKEEKVKVQQLLTPYNIHVSMDEARDLGEYADAVEKYGFIVREFGSDEYRVLAVPMYFNDLAAQDVKHVLLTLIEDLKEGAIRDDTYDRVANKACKASIKAGDEITLVMAVKLLKKMSVCEKPYACPHGRPTMIQITYSDIERMFKRKE